MSANWQFQKRVDSHIVDISKNGEKKSFIEGHFRATDSRFETNPGSSFLGGEIMETSPLSTRLRMRANLHGTGGVSPKSRSFFTRNSVSTRNSHI